MLARDEMKISLTRHGRFMHLPRDQYIGLALERYGEFSQLEVDLFERFVLPGMVAIDVGANIGCHTVALAELTTRRGAVIAFEPIRFLYQCLCGNVALNGIEHVRAYQLALGAEAGETLVPPMDFAEDDNFGGVPLGDWKIGESVTVLPLDAMAPKRVDFMKIDVEGMEQDVLTGAFATIERCAPVLYVENNDTPKRPALMRYIRDALRYDMYWHTPTLYNPNNVRGDTFNPWPDMASINLLCVPRGMEVEGFEPAIVPEESAERKREQLPPGIAP